MISGGAGVAALAFLMRTTRATPKRSSSAPPIPSTSRSKLCFVLSRKPTVNPLSVAGGAGIATVPARSSPTGLNTVILAMDPRSLRFEPDGRDVHSSRPDGHRDPMHGTLTPTDAHRRPIVPQGRPCWSARLLREWTKDRAFYAHRHRLRRHRVPGEVVHHVRARIRGARRPRYGEFFGGPGRLSRLRAGCRPGGAPRLC